MLKTAIKDCSPFFDRVAYDKPLDKYVFSLPKAVDAVVSLRFRGVIPGQIHADVEIKRSEHNGMENGKLT